MITRKQANQIVRAINKLLRAQAAHERTALAARHQTAANLAKATARVNSLLAVVAEGS